MASKTIASLSLALSTQTAEYTKGLNTAKGGVDAFKKGVQKAGVEAGKAFQQMGTELANINPFFGKLVAVVQNGIGAFKGMALGVKGVSVALISTGIGAIIVALGVAFAALSSWISRTTEGADAAKKVWAGVTAVFDQVLDRLSILGSAIGKFVTGDFAGAAKEIRRFWESTKTFVDDVNNKVRQNLGLQERENQLRKDRIAFITREKELEFEIAELRRKAAEPDGPAEKRLGFINRAIALEKQLGDQRRKLAQEEADIQSARVQMSDSNYDDLQKEQELKAQVLVISKTQEDSIRSLIRQQKSLNALVEKERDTRGKVGEELDLRVKFEMPDLTEAEKVIKNALQGKPINLLPRLDDEDAEALNSWTEEQKRLQDELNDSIQKTADVSSTAFDALGSAFDAAGQGAEGFKNSIRGVIKALLSQSIATAIANTLKSTTGLLNLLAIPLAAAAGKGVAALFSAIVPSFATGGIMPYSGVALVGEQGPELVRLPKGSQVFNNSQTNQMLGGAQRVDVRVYGQLRGSDIYIANKEEARKRGNITG